MRTCRPGVHPHFTSHKHRLPEASSGLKHTSITSSKPNFELNVLSHPVNDLWKFCSQTFLQHVCSMFMADRCVCVCLSVRLCVLQLCGVAIMGFGLWLLLDNQSFIVVLSKFSNVIFLSVKVRNEQTDYFLMIVDPFSVYLI